MTEKENPTTVSQVAPGEEGLQSKTMRKKKIMNIIANTSIILMSTLMDGLTELMMGTLGSVASGMAGAIGGEEAEKEVDSTFKQKLPEVDEKMKTMISDVRKDIYLQIEQKKEKIDSFLSDPKFDVGLKIVDAYDFKLPKLTEELGDSTIAAYLQLLIGEDPKFNGMFKKLVDWMNTLPKSV
jgi:hypothetical protein